MRSFIERLIHLKDPGIFISIALFPITLCSYLFKASGSAAGVFISERNF